MDIYFILAAVIILLVYFIAQIVPVLATWTLQVGPCVPQQISSLKR